MADAAELMRKSNARFLKSQAGQTLVEYLLATLMLTMATAGVFGVLGNAVKGAFQQVADVIASETQ